MTTILRTMEEIPNTVIRGITEDARGTITGRAVAQIILRRVRSVRKKELPVHLTVDTVMIGSENHVVANWCASQVMVTSTSA